MCVLVGVPETFLQKIKVSVAVCVRERLCVCVQGQRQGVSSDVVLIDKKKKRQLKVVVADMCSRGGKWTMICIRSLSLSTLDSH